MPMEKHLETMEEVINSIHHACALAQSLESNLPNLANQPATLSLFIDEIVKKLSDAKERLIVLSQHDDQTSSASSFAQLMMPHELHQPHMDATLMQNWLSSTEAMDQLLQAGRSETPHEERALLETKMMGRLEATEASSFPRLRKRGYYRCPHKHDHGCVATRQVHRLDDDPSMYEVTYIGNHTCLMSSTTPSSVPTQQLLGDKSQDITQSTISHDAAADASDGPSKSRYLAHYPVLDMADAMLNSGTSSANEMAPREYSQDQGENDVEMEASDAYLDGGTCVPSHSHDKSTTTSPSEKTREALEIVQDLINNDASILLNPEQCSDMEASLDYLSNLSEDDGISGDMITLISKASREFTHWRMVYNEATMKIESTTSELSRADQLEAGLEDNMKRFRQIVALESDLLQKLAAMEERKKELEEGINAIKADISCYQSEKKKELEEQINDIKADISSYQLEKNMVHRRKRGVFEEGKMLKTQRDELRKKKPHLQHDHGLAKETQTKMIDEWLKLGEKFKKILVE